MPSSVLGVTVDQFFQDRCPRLWIHPARLQLSRCGHIELTKRCMAPSLDSSTRTSVTGSHCPGTWKDRNDLPSALCSFWCNSSYIHPKLPLTWKELQGRWSEVYCRSSKTNEGPLRLLLLSRWGYVRADGWHYLNHTTDAPICGSDHLQKWTREDVWGVWRTPN